jgi:hypothetical protein
MGQGFALAWRISIGNLLGFSAGIAYGLGILLREVRGLVQALATEIKHS